MPHEGRNAIAHGLVCEKPAIPRAPVMSCRQLGSNRSTECGIDLRETHQTSNHVLRQRRSNTDQKDPEVVVTFCSSNCSKHSQIMPEPLRTNLLGRNE